jgi:hypothetical protein
MSFKFNPREGEAGDGMVKVSTVSEIAVGGSISAYLKG